MKFIETARFKRAYKGLPQEVKIRVKGDLRALAIDTGYPSLHTKKIKGTRDIWEARVSLDYRLTFQLAKDYCILRNVGHHGPTLKNP
jgi:mRNA-degrading endonuclease YafQ of YafQ-DinJ toxin-antitoxin module